MSVPSFSLNITVDVPQLERTNELLEQILRQLIRRPPSPPAPAVAFMENSNMPDQISFRVLLPTAPANSDVESGEVTVKIGDDITISRIFAASDAAVSDEAFVGAQGTVVHVEVVWIDDAGNRSLHPGVFDGALADLVPPPDPGAPSLELTGEA